MSAESVRSVIPFVPLDFEYAKRKAKQLRREYPALSNSMSLKVTVLAMGHATDFDLRKTLACGTLPLYDDDLTLNEKYVRTGVQLRALLTFIDVSEKAATEFLQHWKLCAAPLHARKVDWVALSQNDDPDVDAFIAEEPDRKALPGGRYMLIVGDKSSEASHPVFGNGMGRRPDMPLPSPFDKHVDAWHKSDAEFGVMLLGPSPSVSKFLAVRRVNNLLQEVVPRLLAPVAATRGVETRLIPTVLGGLSDLLQLQYEAVLQGAELPLQASGKIRREVGTNSFRVTRHDCVAWKMIASALWYRVARQTEAAKADGITLSPEAIKEAHASRTVVYENGRLGLQYLLSESDALEVFARPSEFELLTPEEAVTVAHHVGKI
jgi:hypothetical protein